MLDDPRLQHPEASSRPRLGLVAAGRPVAKVATDLDISDQTICTRRRQELIDTSRLPGLTSSDNTELVAARRRIAELGTEPAIHRRAAELLQDTSAPKGATGRGLVIGRSTVELLMRRTGIEALPDRRRPRPRHDTPVAVDLVGRNFARPAPNQLWVPDITEHPAREGEVHCAVVLDVHPRPSWAGPSTPPRPPCSPRTRWARPSPPAPRSRPAP